MANMFKILQIILIPNRCCRPYPVKKAMLAAALPIISVFMTEVSLIFPRDKLFIKPMEKNMSIAINELVVNCVVILKPSIK
ncbi:hypothetical protein EI16_08620 [Hydrogenovibrio marinus]|uniref:Uncharacterized protein n=1 Tax=Hydrogenovibrio marinus TaxID=28885 RepID=A0A066ZRA2_HYDMR|nr:hypothetical protein EI16_08620 [Hydrogenovibrio marinus]BBN60479.1 hypothetical protein HVMH_2073 [Hydrogenovibrio marinus]